MNVTYLINQYPTPTHTFIRREIAALEAAGIDVERVSLRPASADLTDPLDRAEAGRTRAVLDAGLPGHHHALLRLLAAVARVALERPRAFADACRLTLRIGLGSDRGLARNLAYLAEACVLLGWLEDSRCEHLHAHFATNGTAVAMLCRALGGPPYSFTLHGPDDLERAPRLALGEKLARAAFAAAISDFARGQLHRWCDDRDRERIHVVRCAVDHRALAARRVPLPEEPRFACVGRLSAQKGQMLLVDAAARLAADLPRFELVLVGDGPQRDALESRVRSLGLGRHVRITGWASGAEVERSIGEARALVLPSLAEGISVAAMEAMALGRPVICTDVGGMTELVEHGAHGWVIRPGSVDALVEAMRDAALAPAAKLEQMGDRGRARVAERHDAAAEARKLLDLFRDPARQASTSAATTSSGNGEQLTSNTHSAHRQVAAPR